MNSISSIQNLFHIDSKIQKINDYSVVSNPDLFEFFIKEGKSLYGCRIFTEIYYKRIGTEKYHFIKKDL